MTNGTHTELRGLDKTVLKNERQLLNTRSAEKIVLVQSNSSKTVNPSRIYALEISRRVEALRQANGLSNPLESSKIAFTEQRRCSTSQHIQAVELVKQWSATHFLPMLFCLKKMHGDSKYAGTGNDDAEVADVTSLRCLSRPKKGLRLPLVFKKGKKLDLAR